MSVFVDTSAWYALLDRRDAHHSEAVRSLEALRRMGLRPVTHDSSRRSPCSRGAWGSRPCGTS